MAQTFIEWPQDGANFTVSYPEKQALFFFEIRYCISKTDLENKIFSDYFRLILEPILQ